jgi:hypothetical protein
MNDISIPTFGRDIGTDYSSAHDSMAKADNRKSGRPGDQVLGQTAQGRKTDLPLAGVRRLLGRAGGAPGLRSFMDSLPSQVRTSRNWDVALLSMEIGQRPSFPLYINERASI